MKLAYIYIQKHRALENIDIPINGSHKCNYSCEQLTLRFCPNELDYYQGVDCSAIIGKNGVGKSTILDFLEVAHEGTDSSGIIVWFDSMTKKYHICAINLYLNNNSVVSKQDYTFEKDLSNLTKRHKIRLIKANNLTGVETNDFSRKKKSNSFIYDMSLSQYVKGSRKVVAQRTNRLIQYFSSSESFNKLEQPKVKFTFQFSTSSTAYLKALLTNEQFVSRYVKPKEYFNILQDRSNDRFNEFNLNKHQDFTSQLLRANLLSICSYLSKLSIIKKNHRDEFFIQLIVGMERRWFSKEDLREVLSEIRNKSDIDHSDTILESDAYIIIRKYQEIIDNFEKISYFLNIFENEYEWHEGNKLATFNADFIIKLTNCIFDFPPLLLNNFKYGWNGFSTGEFAKSNLFSELYNYIHNQKNNSINSHLIVMDEVDLYLHPDWQRTFFSELLEFVRIEFPKDSVQIILSTHSPIIISDFLPEDIVSLDRKIGKTKVVESFGFASHITDLYVEGMHLNSTFGEHSKKAINQLLVRSTNKTLTEQDISLIKKIKSKNIQQMILNSNDQS